MQNNKLISFNEGGSHESNPYSGIPIGGNNRVEEGETKNKNFIYSDRLYANEDLARQFNLPGYIKGKTFANASKAIDTKFDGRSDIHSNATKKELLDRLSGAQEHLKQQEEQINQSLQANSQQVPDMMNGQVPEGMEEYINQEPQQEQQFAFGGDIYGDPIDPPIQKTRQELSNLSINDSISGSLNSTVKPIVKIQSGVRNDKMGPGYYVYSKYPVQNVESDREFISNAGYSALRGTKPYQEYMKSYNPVTMTYGVNKFGDGGNVSTNNPYIMQPGQLQPLTQVVTNDAQVEQGKSQSSLEKEKNYIKAYNSIAPTIGNSINSAGGDEKRTSTLQSINTIGNSAEALAGSGNQIGSYVQGATGLYEMGAEAFGKSNVSTSGLQSQSGASAGKSAGSGALKGAGTGATIGSIIPGVGTVIGAGVGAIVGGVAGLIGGKKDERNQALNNSKYARNINKQFSDQYAKGGYLKQYAGGGLYTISGKKPLIIPNQGQSIIEERDLDLQSNNRWDKPDRDISEIDREIINGVQSDESPLDFSKVNRTNNSESLYSKASNYLDKNGGKFLKYAPVAMNAYQLSQLKKPENKQLQRLSDRYNPQYVDESQLQNIVRQEGNNQTAAIQQMGGSEGALRNSLLATGLNKTKALSNAYMKSSELNRGQDEKAQEFNSRINQFNAQTQHQESENHERNEAAYRSNKSKLLDQLGSSIGSIGKEEVNKNQISEALGYDWDGKHHVDKKTGEKLTTEELLAKQKETKKEYKFEDKSSKFGNISYNPFKYKF